MKLIKTFLAGILALSMLLCLCACGGESKDESSQTESEVNSNESVAESQTESETESKDESVSAAAFTVNVVDQDGNPVAGAMVQICKDSCIPGKADENGVVTFNVEITDGYKLSVLSCPEGYEYTGEAEVYLESGSTEYTLELTKGN